MNWTPRRGRGCFVKRPAMGVLQVHLSGGEPASRRDLVEIVAAAHDAGLYTNLITSAIGLDTARLIRLKEVGLDHVQLSLQDVYAKSADRIAGYPGRTYASSRSHRVWAGSGSRSPSIP